MKRISSQENPFYKELIKLASSTRERKKIGYTLLDGPHLLLAYIASGKQPLHLIVTTGALEDAEISSLLLKLPEVPSTLLDDALFTKLSELKTVSGVLALISIPHADTAPQNDQFCVLLENIQDPGNLGSILRSAAAAGCDSVYMSKGCADAWSPKVLRAAMGGHFVLKLYEHADLLTVAREFTGTIFSAALSGKISLYGSDLKGRVAFAIGNEGSGLSEALLDSTYPFVIPMLGKVESLNAAAAAAICLFEAVRQRS